jgi:hypothetical protein
MFIADRLNSTAQRLSDFALRVQRDTILNTGNPTRVEGDIAAQLMQASRAILAEAIDPSNGLVDYASLKQRSTYHHFRELTSGLIILRIDDLGEGPAYKAFWINIYNALIIDAIIQYDLHGSMMRRPGISRQAAYHIQGMRFSADDIEHGILRQNRPNPVLPFKPFSSDDPRANCMVEQFDPRIHFALVCGTKSCPPISYYSPERLDTQLDQAASSFINGGAVRWEPSRQTLWLSKIFDWYEEDFGGKDGVLDFLRRYGYKDEIRDLPPSSKFRLRYTPYDWSINKFEI